MSEFKKEFGADSQRPVNPLSRLDIIPPAARARLQALVLAGMALSASAMIPVPGVGGPASALPPLVGEPRPGTSESEDSELPPLPDDSLLVRLLVEENVLRSFFLHYATEAETALTDAQEIQEPEPQQVDALVEMVERLQRSMTEHQRKLHEIIDLAEKKGYGGVKDSSVRFKQSVTSGFMNLTRRLQRMIEELTRKLQTKGKA